MNDLYVADFETTTLEEDCRVWGWGLYNILENKFCYGTTIDIFFKKVFSLPNKTTLYFHNLKFDGEFIFYWLFRNGYKHTTERKLYNGEFKTLISYMGVFYSIVIKHNDKEITIYDSLKIIPLQVKQISKAFGIEQLKGEIDYTKERPIGYKIHPDEVEYIKNDVEIVGKALLYFFSQNLKKMTQASNAFADYKSIMGDKKFRDLFPVLDCDDELRESYKGGWTYANPKYLEKTVGRGIVFDVNSLYPSVMYFDKLPYGEPIYYDGKYEPDKIYSLYIQMIQCQFELKEGMLPTLQLKHNFRFNPTEYVTSSGDEMPTLYLTSVDLELFLKHYNVYNLEYIHGWKFKGTDKLFKQYIDKWMQIKQQATIDGNEGLRTLAKLMLNALYGKFGLNPNVQSKNPKWDGEYVCYENGEQDTRESIYIPIATFITAYARSKTITSAQQNYNRFLYADTDSLHLLGEELPDIDIDNVKLGAWKFEGKFNKARYLRAKSYIENMYLTEEEWDKLKPEKQKKYNRVEYENEVLYESVQIACAGLPKNLHENVNFDNFKNGLVINGKLQHKRVKGGVILKTVDFSIDL